MLYLLGTLAHATALPQPPAGHGALCVARPAERFERKRVFEVQVNKAPVGSLANGTLWCVAAEPGEYKLGVKTP